MSTRLWGAVVAADVKWLNPDEDRAWRAYLHAHQQLAQRLNRHLVQDSGITHADYEVLAALSEDPAGRLPAQELCAQMRWEKSRLSHQVRRMQEQGLISREPNPADARSVMICLLPRGRRVSNVRQHFIDLLSPAELAALASVSERVLRHLAGEHAAGDPPETHIDEPVDS